MIRDFEAWSGGLIDVSQLEDLSGTCIGIDAADYINARVLDRPRLKEPLVPALGGLPLGLDQYVNEDLKRLADLHIRPLFVFSGLDVSKQDDPFRQRQQGAAMNAGAWDLYDKHQAEHAVAKFGESTYVTPEDLFRALQDLLVKKHIQFLVAPYSAWAQLAYLERTNTVQSITGPSEILLFECDKVIINVDFEAGTFKWIRRNKCIGDLKKHINNGDVSEDMFVDACMLAGNHFIPTLPTLETPPRNKVIKPLGAIDIMMVNGRSGYAAASNIQDDPMPQRNAYVDKYRKARLAVKHQTLLTIDGKIQPMLNTQLTPDAHEFIGQRLPEEIYYYFSRGLINSRILTWRTTSEIIEVPPVDGGESLDYHNLVSQKLTPLRSVTMCLLSSSLHNWYQHKDLTLRCWFPDQAGKLLVSNISMRGSVEYRTSAPKWNVKEAVFQDAVAKVQPAGYLGSAVLSLTDAGFASKTVTTKTVNGLSTSDEIIYNTIWRFLTLREYIDSNHNLTAWGKVLATIIAPIKGDPVREEAAITSLELFRLGLLNNDNMFVVNGAPMRGEERDRKHNLLISRVAGLGVLRHNPIGFTGPLSQHLLAYNSVINAVRSTLRDMVEVCAVNMFMTACANREITNLSEISMQLPFLLHLNCALSIAVKSYLDELSSHEDPTSADTKAGVKETATTRYFPQSQNFVADLQSAFEMWDAVAEGVTTAGTLIPTKDQDTWKAAVQWLSSRR